MKRTEEKKGEQVYITTFFFLKSDFAISAIENALWMKYIKN